MQQVIFKSSHENFRKEYLGLKSNTVRICDDATDMRFISLKSYMDGDLTILLIKIMNPLQTEFFVRKVTDVTLFNRLWVISWEHVK